MSEWTSEHQALYELPIEELEALRDEYRKRRPPTRAEVLADMEATDPVRYERLTAKAEKIVADADKRSIDYFAKKVADRDAELADQSQATRGERQLDAIGRGWANLMGGSR